MKFAKPAALNRDTHRQLRFRPQGGFAFAAGFHAAPLGASEFFPAAKEYAIVFIRSTHEEPLPVVILGLKQDQNLFVSGDGHWNARYLPLSIRSYPFATVETRDSSNRQVVIDEAYLGFGDTAGTPLFADGGEPGVELEATLRLLQSQQHDIAQTRRLGADLSRLGLLTERSAQLVVAGEQFNLNGFSIVDEAKLNALDDLELLPLARKGHLSLITAHLLSISNLGGLGPKLKPAAERATRPRPVAKTKASVHAKD